MILTWLKKQGMEIAIGFMMDLVAECSDEIINKFKKFVVKKYNEALKTEKQWDELAPSFFHDLLTDEQPMFMIELKEEFYELLIPLYKWCVTNTSWKGDEKLVIILFEAIGKPTPALKVE